MSMGSDSTWVGKKSIRRIGGLSDALSIASDLGFTVAPPPSQEELQSLASSNGERGDDLIRVLREFSAIQRKLQTCRSSFGRKDDKNVAHLTHIALGNILKFRKKNWQFDLLSGIVNFLLVFSLFPQVTPTVLP